MNEVVIACAITGAGDTLGMDGELAVGSDAKASTLAGHARYTG